jgi:hypothetical protein
MVRPASIVVVLGIEEHAGDICLSAGLVRDQGVLRDRAEDSIQERASALTVASLWNSLLYRTVPLGAPVGAGLPWPVMWEWDADAVAFTVSVTIQLSP